jgi:putative ABC transport system ATP-binding protein
MSNDQPSAHGPLEEGVVFHVHGVTKIYQMGEVQVHALRGVDLDLYRGEFTVLLASPRS